MIVQHWAAIAAEICARWPEASFPKSSVVLYGRELADLDAAHVQAAVAAWDRDGNRFPPTAGQLRQKILELDADAPPWVEAFRWIQRLAQTGWGGPYYGPRWGETVQRADAMLHEMPDSVRSFIEAAGRQQIVMNLHEGGDGEARLRHKWEAYVQRTVRDASMAGLDGGGLRAIGRVNSEPRQIGPALQAGLVALEEAS